MLFYNVFFVLFFNLKREWFLNHIIYPQGYLRFRYCAPFSNTAITRTYHIVEDLVTYCAADRSSRMMIDDGCCSHKP